MRWRRRVKVQVASILSIDQAAQLGHAWYARKLAPDWRRHTPDEAAALFARLGLEPEFWRVH